MVRSSSARVSLPRMLLVVISFGYSKHYWCYCSSVKCSRSPDPDVSGGIKLDCSGRSLERIPSVRAAENITILILSKNSISTIKDYDLHNFSDLRHLDLSSNLLDTIAESAFQGLAKLSYLNLNFNKLTTWPDKALSPLNNLRELYLDGAIGHDILLGPLPVGFRNLSKLEHLIISYLHFGIINETFFTYVGRAPITTLDMSDSTLLEVTSGAFKYFTRLRTLKLKAVYILTEQSIRNIFSDLNGSDLTDVDLSANDVLNVLDQFLFKNFTQNNLKRLLFSWTDIVHIAPGAFDNLINLEELFLDHTQLDRIEASSFQPLRSLKYLDLTGTSIKEYNFSASKMDSLQILNMSSLESLQEIKAHGFMGLVKLEELILASSAIDTLDYCAFCGLPKLKRLNLAYINLSRVNCQCFSGLRSVQSLDLSGSGIWYLNESLLDDLTGLENLTLDYNNFIHLSKNSFRILPVLKHLSMKNCSLTSDHGLFTNLRHLESICLEGNANIHLSSHAFRGNTNLRTVILSSIHTITSLPATLNDLQLEYLDVSNDKLANFSTSNVSYLNSSKLNRFAGGHNPYVCSCKQLDFLMWFNATDKIADDRTTYQCDNQQLNQFDWRSCKDLPAYIASVTILSVLVLAVSIFVIYRNRWYLDKLWYEFCRRYYERLEMERESQLCKQCRYDAFVSCSNKGVKFVKEKLIPNLEQPPEGEHVFKLIFEERDFVSGPVHATQIKESIEASRKTIIVLDSSYIQDDWKLFEYICAKSEVAKGKNVVIVVLMEEVDFRNVPSSVVGLLGTDQILTWTTEEDGQEIFWRDMRDALRQPAYYQQTKT